MATWPKSQHDSLPLPGGKTVGKVPSDELRRILEAAGVPGVNSGNGREANIGAYAEHVERIRENGATRALAEWLVAKEGN